jgi:hypothetical protein
MVTEKELLMYKVLGAITVSGAPIVFIGGLISKLVLLENGYSALDRATIDIDAHWIDKPPSMETLENAVSQSLINFGKELTVKATREYSENKTAEKLQK